MCKTVIYDFLHFLFVITELQHICVKAHAERHYRERIKYFSLYALGYDVVAKFGDEGNRGLFIKLGKKRIRITFIAEDIHSPFLLRLFDLCLLFLMHIAHFIVERKQRAFCIHTVVRDAFPIRTVISFYNQPFIFNPGLKA